MRHFKLTVQGFGELFLVIT